MPIVTWTSSIPDSLDQIFRQLNAALGFRGSIAHHRYKVGFVLQADTGEVRHDDMAAAHEYVVLTCSW